MRRMSRFIAAALPPWRSEWAWRPAASDSGSSSGGGSDTIIRGTTDQPISLDPAGAYDLPSYDIIYNVYQNLVQFPPGETKPVPEAAESCDFTDDVTFECKMRADNVFSDGSTLDAEDVVFSFERNVEIADPERRLLAAREHEERRGPGQGHGRLQPRGAGRDLALGAGDRVVRDRPVGHLPGRQAPGRRAA